MTDGPSIAAIVAPWDPAGTLERLGRALVARGMRPHVAPLPAGYKPAPSEWIGATTLPLAPHRRGREASPNAALVTTDVPRIFHFALQLSAAYPDEVFAVWRRFSGLEPVAKIVWGGRPRWKEGDDPDHEVAFPVPIGQPAEVRPPSEPRVPLELSALTAMLAPIVRPLKDPIAARGAAWLAQSSRLA